MRYARVMIPVFISIIILTTLIFVAQFFDLFNLTEFLSFYNFLFLGVSAFGLAYFAIPILNLQDNNKEQFRKDLNKQLANADKTVNHSLNKLNNM